MIKEWDHSLLRRADARSSSDIYLPYVTQIATLPVKHCYWRHKVGHTKNI